MRAYIFSLRGGSKNSITQFKLFPRSQGGNQISSFPEFKKVQNIREGGGGVKKIMDFSTFWDIFDL